MRINKIIAPWLISMTCYSVGCGKPAFVAKTEDHSQRTSSFAEQWQNVSAGISEQIVVDSEVLSDQTFAKLVPTDKLVTLILDAGAITDDSLRKTICQCPSIEHLRLRKSPITDAGMKEIAKLSDLRILNLPHAACTETGIRELGALTKLRQLRLGSTSADGKICRAIREITSITAIHLIDIPIQDSDLMELAELPKLYSLYIDGGQISDKGWARLFERRPELHVHINSKHHDLDPHRDHE